MWLSSEFNRMAEKTFKAYEPDDAFFSTLLYGPEGVGKSTLLVKCCQRLKEKKTILYIDAQDFVKNYAFAAQEGTLSQFRLRLRTPGVLIMDHIEVLKGKTRSIEEFYHTYEALFQRNGRIICGFRGDPTQLGFLGEKLSSRLRGGLVVPILQPTPEDMLNYLRQMAYGKFLIVEDLVLELMAEEAANFPKAQSLMNGFIQFANRTDSALDHGALLLYLQERRYQEGLRPSPQNIIQKVAELTGVAAAAIYSTTRTPEVRQARQLAIYGIRSLSRLSYPEIGASLNKSHSSIMKSYQQFQEAVQKNPELREMLESLVKYFNSPDDENTER